MADFVFVERAIGERAGVDRRTAAGGGVAGGATAVACGAGAVAFAATGAGSGLSFVAALTGGRSGPGPCASAGALPSTSDTASAATRARAAGGRVQPTSARYRSLRARRVTYPPVLRDLYEMVLVGHGTVNGAVAQVRAVVGGRVRNRVAQSQTARNARYAIPNNPPIWSMSREFVVPGLGLAPATVEANLGHRGVRQFRGAIQRSIGEEFRKIGAESDGSGSADSSKLELRTKNGDIKRTVMPDVNLLAK